MKTLAIAALVLLTSACVSHSGRYYGDDGRRAGSAPVAAAGQDHEVICHKGKKTMSLPSSAVQAHLGHGDHRGPC
jgi:hypothetical protein